MSEEKLNNASVRMRGIDRNSERSELRERLEYVRKLSLEERKYLKEKNLELKKTKKEVLDTVKYMSGKDISEKSFKKIEDKAEIVSAETITEVFNRPSVNAEGHVKYVPFVHNVEAKYSLQMNKDLVTKDDLETIERSKNKYRNREGKVKFYMREHDQILECLKIVETEKKEQMFLEKKVKAKSLTELGKMLMKNHEIQPVRIEKEITLKV